MAKQIIIIQEALPVGFPVLTQHADEFVNAVYPPYDSSNQLNTRLPQATGQRENTPVDTSCPVSPSSAAAAAVPAAPAAEPDAAPDAGSASGATAVDVSSQQLTAEQQEAVRAATAAAADAGGETGAASGGEGGEGGEVAAE